MDLNNKQQLLLKKLNSRFLFKLVSIAKLPMALITGLKIEEITHSICKTRVNYSYLNKNPFQSTYFAVQSMAAELSTGALALLYVGGLNSDVSFILIGVKANFLKKAKDKTFFICKEGEAFHNTVKEARRTKLQTIITVSTIGFNNQSEIVSEFEFTWSFKVRDIK